MKIRIKWYQPALQPGRFFKVVYTKMLTTLFSTRTSIRRMNKLGIKL